MTPYPSDDARRAAFAKKRAPKTHKQTGPLPAKPGPKPVVYVEGQPRLLEEFLRDARITQQEKAAVRRLQPSQVLQVGKGPDARVVERAKGPLGTMPQPVLLVDGEAVPVADFLKTLPKTEQEQVRALKPGSSLKLGKRKVTALATPVSVPGFGNFACLLDDVILACPEYLDGSMDLENLVEADLAGEDHDEFVAAARRAIKEGGQ